MKNRKLLYTILLTMLLSLPSCSWLDVTSKSEVGIEEMFSTREGFYTTLSGIYISMGGNDLYGNNLCLYALEPLTQQYTVSDNQIDRTKWVQFQYTTDEGEKLISHIWSTMYNTIVNCNVVIGQLQKADIPVFEPGVTDILLGEALGLRAFMYFDLIRMFNESYTLNPQSSNVPFKTDFGFSIGEKITTDRLLEKLTADLEQARKLLQDNDPIVTGKSYNDKYVSFDRTQRMNYYAATALMARIEMFRENYQEAYRLADEIIKSDRFRFIRPEEIIETDIYGKELKVDRVFMPEMIFSLYTETILSASKTTYEGLTQDFVKSSNCYEESDVRKNWLYTNPSANYKINMIRYQRSQLAQDASKYAAPVVPMLKISEMYLIAAEASLKDKNTGGDAVSLLNRIKKERLASELPANADDEKVQTEITHEYICDFKGEGQLFYYYKRNNMSAIDDGRYNGNTVIMKPENYKFPLPKYEQDFGYGKSNGDKR